MSSEGTTKVTVTMNEKTKEWLEQRYPDATSNSQAVVLAISDARDFEKLVEADRLTVER